MEPKRIEGFLEHIVKVKEVLKPSLDALGIVISTFDKRTLHLKEAKGLIEKEFGRQVRIFQTTISHTTKIKNSYSTKMPIVYYDPSSSAAQQLVSLAVEVEHAIA